MPKPLPIKTPETPKWAEGLTLRERRFVEEYVIDLNGRQAAVRAGLGKTAKSSTEMASRMRKKASVAAAINALMAERSGATAVSVVDEISRIAFAKFSDFARVEDGRLIITDTALLTEEQQSAIAEISETVNENGRTIKIKLHSKLDALEKLMKALGAYKERAEVDHNHRLTVEEDDDPLKRIQARLEQLRKNNGAWEMNRGEVQPPLERALPADVHAGPVIDGKVIKSH